MPMTPEHERLRQLVLAWEECDPSERAEAEAHLGECPECRLLRESFGRQERAPGPRGELSPASLETPATLSPRERREADASRAALLEKLGLATTGGAREAVHPIARDRTTWRRWAAWLAPAAAVAAAVVLWLGMPRPSPVRVIEEASVVRAGVVRGAGPPPADTTWKSGDAFEVRVRLAREGWPVLVLVDPSGAITLLRPAGRETLRAGAGLLRIAPADAGLEWVLEGPPGPEDFFVSARADRPVDREALARALEAAGRRTGREQRLEAVRRALERYAGPVRRVTLDHR